MFTSASVGTSEVLNHPTFKRPFCSRMIQKISISIRWVIFIKNTFSHYSLLCTLLHTLILCKEKCKYSEYFSSLYSKNKFNSNILNLHKMKMVILFILLGLEVEFSSFLLKQLFYILYLNLDFLSLISITAPFPSFQLHAFFISLEKKMICTHTNWVPLSIVI